MPDRRSGRSRRSDSLVFMKVLITGGRGMLARDLTAQFSRGHDVTTMARPELDIRSLTDCRGATTGRDVVVNAAAWTDVDGAEAHEAEAFGVNAVGAGNLARACHETGARLVHLSTDYVFAGDADTPYPETAPSAPRSAYGRTKAAGEWAVRAETSNALIVRTAWLYGAGGQNFVRTMARLAGERESISVVDDQLGQPTTTRDLAVFVRTLVEDEVPSGTYHGSSEGETTWFGLCRAVFEELGLDTERVQPTTTAEFPRPAPRPAYSVLGHDRTREVGVDLLPDWRTALTETIHDVLKANP